MMEEENLPHRGEIVKEPKILEPRMKESILKWATKQLNILEEEKEIERDHEKLMKFWDDVIRDLVPLPRSDSIKESTQELIDDFYSITEFCSTIKEILCI